MRINKNKKAFTLAEVLITLSILGVVAAITIPSVYRNYQRKTTVVKILKYHSEFAKAYDLIKIENGNRDIECPDSHKKIFDTIVKPYFRVVYDAGTDSSKKGKILSEEKYKNLNGNDWTALNNTTWYSAKLADGTVFTTRYSSNDIKEGYGNCGSIYIDVNGKKGPNQFGRDLFTFILNTNGSKIYEISPYNKAWGTEMKTRMESYCGKKTSGAECAAWIVGKRNMNYLDCPGTVDYDTGGCK